MNKPRLIILMCSLILLFSTPALAILTPINSNGYDDDAVWGLISPGGILNTLYGLNNLSRIDDDFDRLWYVSGNGKATVKAKAAAYWQSLYAGSQQPFTSVTGFGYSSILTVLPNNPVDITTTGVFAFYDDPNGSVVDPVPWSSIPSENLYGNNDHMVTWKIVGGDESKIGNYVICWEDLNLGDYDYNDLVVELSGVSPVPEPASFSLLGLGLLGLLGLKKKNV